MSKRKKSSFARKIANFSRPKNNKWPGGPAPPGQNPHNHATAPPTWTSQEDGHLLLCRELVARGVQPVVIFSAPLKPEFERKFLDEGALVFGLSYEKGALRFYRSLKEIFTQHNVTLAHIIFFDYFSLVAWLVRAAGVKRIVYEMQNSGIFRATSWKRLLLRELIQPSGDSYANSKNL